MKTVSIQEAEADLSRLLEDAAKGDPFIVTRDGKPLVKVVAVEPAPSETGTEEPPKKRRIGTLDGLYHIPDDLDAGLDKEIEDLFYNGRI